MMTLGQWLGYSNDEVRPLVRVSGLSFVECFDNDGD